MWKKKKKQLKGLEFRCLPSRHRLFLSIVVDHLTFAKIFVDISWYRVTLNPEGVSRVDHAQLFCNVTAEYRNPINTWPTLSPLGKHYRKI